MRSFGCALFICRAFGEEVGDIKDAEYHFDGIVASIYDDYITDDEEAKALAKKEWLLHLEGFMPVVSVKSMKSGWRNRKSWKLKKKM